VGESDSLRRDRERSVAPRPMSVSESSFPWSMIAVVVGSLVTVGILWGTAMPLGIPGEWVWERLPADPQTMANLLLAAFGAVLYLGFVILGERRLSREAVSKAETIGWLIGLGVAGFCWLWTVQETAPPAAQLGKAPFVLFYPGSSGYFLHARYKAPQAGPFLRSYEALMREGDVLHEGTHPPGLFLVFHGLIAFIDAQPWVIPWLQSTEPQSVQEAFEVIRENEQHSLHGLDAPADRAVLWLATLLAMTATAATVWPLYGHLRATYDRPTSWTATALWPAVPAAAVFLPKSDAVFPFLACLTLLMLMKSLHHRSLWRGLVAGLILFAALFSSLAFLPVMLFGVLGTIAYGVRDSDRQQGLRNLLPTVMGVIVGLLVPIVLLWLVTRMNLFTVWSWNLHNHAGFYGKFTRTYWKWLLVNPAELGFALGAPLTIAAMIGLPLRRQWTEWSHADVMAVLAVGVWGLLWLSGKNSGEAARLWVLFLPAAVWMAANGWQHAAVSTRQRWLWLALQLAVSIATVHRVAGFHFG